MSDRPAREVDLAATARAVVAGLAPLAAAKGIDLGVDASGAIRRRRSAHDAGFEPRQCRTLHAWTRTSTSSWSARTPRGACGARYGTRHFRRTPRVFDRFYRGASATRPPPAAASKRSSNGSPSGTAPKWRWSELDGKGWASAFDFQPDTRRIIRTHNNDAPTPRVRIYSHAAHP